MEKKQTLGLCMIVKNEEKNLRRCLSSVAHIVDEIIIVDTGSEDQTVEIAEEFGAAVYSYQWNNDFSAARNFSIRQCTADWVLLLDADEELGQEAGNILIPFLSNQDFDGAHFTIHNYMGTNLSDNINIHIGLRLIRNNGKYHFTGEIHEQISCITGETCINKFTILDMKLHHYGYMDDEVNAKQKRCRNIPILESLLEKDPENSFTLFNMGNEYLAMEDFKKALEYYDKAYSKIHVQEAYAPHLFFRMANCHDHLKEYEKALSYLNEGLEYYPKCTDFEYVKGCVLKRLKRYSLAIESLKKCMEMGEAPLTTRFVNDCGTYRPAAALGELYEDLSDYDKALEYYHKALFYRSGEYVLLYRIGAVLNKIYQDKNTVLEKLMEYFADPDYEPNLILTWDILLNEKLYDLTLAKLEAEDRSSMQNGKYRLELEFLKGKAYFYTKKYSQARTLFLRLSMEDERETIIPRIPEDSIKYLFLINLINKTDQMPAVFKRMEELNGEGWYYTCKLLYEIHAQHVDSISKPCNGEMIAGAIVLLNILLKTGEYEVFQSLLPIFNKVNDRRVLLYLSKIYYANGFSDMAVKSILRSIKEMDVIDEESIRILWKEIR